MLIVEDKLMFTSMVIRHPDLHVLSQSKNGTGYIYIDKAVSYRQSSVTQ